MPALALPRRLGAPRLAQAASLVLPVAVAALAASAAYAGADTTFAQALTKFTYFTCSLYVLTRFGYTRIEK